ncbi:hypothetical protein ACJJIF_06030 [Microbulbifer sp. SSSA002]
MGFILDPTCQSVAAWLSAIGSSAAYSTEIDSHPQLEYSPQTNRLILKYQTGENTGILLRNFNEKSLVICIQALQTAIKFNEFLSQSETTENDNYEESSYMYELEPYRQEEAAGSITIPLSPC